MSNTEDNPYQNLRQWEKAFALAQVAAMLEDPLIVADPGYDWTIAARLAEINRPSGDVITMAVDMVMLTIGVHNDDPRSHDYVKVIG